MSEASDKLVQDLKVVITDAEVVLKETATAVGEKAIGARAKLEEGLRAARAKLEVAEKAIYEKGKIAAQATDKFVKDNPYKVIGAAFATGIVLGLLINRKN
ncbi:MAG: DUF883 family protein [Verrucomicrobiae bacterium]|nr:DUF883 family protein [Verrucomicrobiae bacterium]